MKREERIVCAQKRVVSFPAKANKCLTGHLNILAKLLRVLFLWYFSYFEDLPQTEQLLEY